MNDHGRSGSCRHLDDGVGDHYRGRFLIRWVVGNSTLAGFFALLWLVLRSGARPSRLAYPCQQAALTSAGLAFGGSLIAAVVAARRGLTSSMKRPSRVIAAAIGVLLTVTVSGHLIGVDANQVRHLTPSADYRATVFHVTSCPQQPQGERFPGLDRLLELMGSDGLFFYRSSQPSPLASPDGIIGADDVVVIKINYQWAARGGTNTDLLMGLIRAIADHPDGFAGEVVVCENVQFAEIENFDRRLNNAEDWHQSPRRVVEDFRQQGLAVSLVDWTRLRMFEVEDFSSGYEGYGYVKLEQTPWGIVTYPKFRTEFGTSISLKEGVWDPVTRQSDRSRLKLVNLPVLKSHAAVYGVTACVKNYMGLVSNTLTDSHSAVGIGLMGKVMAEIGPPDLNILDCIWINANPVTGPATGYSGATRLDQLVASIDPVAADIWAVRNILVPAFLANGFSPPWPYPSADPDDPNSSFRRYLDNSMDALLAAGYQVTNRGSAIDVISADAAFPRPDGREATGRAGPG